MKTKGFPYNAFTNLFVLFKELNSKVDVICNVFSPSGSTAGGVSGASSAKETPTLEAARAKAKTSTKKDAMEEQLQTRDKC